MNIKLCLFISAQPAHTLEGEATDERPISTTTPILVSKRVEHTRSSTNDVSGLKKKTYEIYRSESNKAKQSI